MVGTDPFTRVSVEAKPALYWPLLLKQSDVKWLAHTHKLRWTAAGTLSLKMKRNHCLFCCSVAGTEYRHWCWFLQPTTEQFVCLTLSDDIENYCYLTAGHIEIHLGMSTPLSDISYHHAEEASLWKWLLLLRNERSWIWTARKSTVLPVGGLRRPCRNRWLSLFWELAGSGRTGLYM